MLPKLTLLSNALDRLNTLVVNDETPIESARRAADSLIKYCLNPDSDKAEKLALVAADVLAGKPKLLRDAPFEERRGDCLPISDRLPVPPDDDGVSDPDDLVEKTFLDYGVPGDFDEHDVAFYRAKFIKQILANRARASDPSPERERRVVSNGCPGPLGSTEPRARARGATPPQGHLVAAPTDSDSTEPRAQARGATPPQGHLVAAPTDAPGHAPRWSPSAIGSPTARATITAHLPGPAP